MGLTHFPHGLTSFGIPLVGGAGLITSGTSYFVDAALGNDGNVGTDIKFPLKSILAAYNKCTSGKGDVIYFIPSATADIWTAKLDWVKTYTHLIGLHPGWMSNRCRIACSTITASMTPLLTVSGQGCIMANLLISQEGSHATFNAVPLRVTGHRTFFKNVHCRNIGASAITNASHRSLTIGSAYDVSFDGCTFGETSYDSGVTTSLVIEFDGTNGGKYLFRDCTFLGAGGAGTSFAKWGDACGGYTLFRDCLFHNRSGTGAFEAMTRGFQVASGTDAVIFKNCQILGVTALESAGSGSVFGDNAWAAGTSQRTVALTG